MTKCDIDKLFAYLENGRRDEAVTAHLRECPSCRSELQRCARLFNGLQEWRAAALECPWRQKIIDAVCHEQIPDAAHLAACPSCAALAETLQSSLRDLDNRAAATAPLPSALDQLVAARKKKWLAEKVGKVLDFQGVSGRAERRAKLKKILDNDDCPLDLPRAAFPDDLDSEE